MEIKTQINKWDLIKLKSFCTVKQTINKVKRQASEWGEIRAKETTDKELISRIYKQLIRLNIKQSNQKVRKRPQQTFLQRRHTDGWKNTWKDPQHRSLLEKCKSKLQWGITSHQSEWPSSKSLQTINAGEGMEKRECSCTVGGNANWYSHYGRWYAAAAAKLPQSCPTLFSSIDSSPSGSAIPGILQARTLGWVAIAFSEMV